MDELLKLLKDIRPDVDFEKEDRLVDDGVLDSFSIITVVSEINSAFNINIQVGDLVPENLNNIEAMWELISRLKK